MKKLSEIKGISIPNLTEDELLQKVSLIDMIKFMAMTGDLVSVTDNWNSLSTQGFYEPSSGLSPQLIDSRSQIDETLLEAA